jgi:hypothetical protein
VFKKGPVATLLQALGEDVAESLKKSCVSNTEQQNIYRIVEKLRTTSLVLDKKKILQRYV